MIDDARTDRIQIDVDEALPEMHARFDGGGVVAAFPESPGAALPAIVVQRHATCRQQDRPRNDVLAAVGVNEEMDMVGGDRPGQDAQPVLDLGPIDPVHPVPAIAREPKQEGPVVTAVRDVPRVAWKQEQFGARHFDPSLLSVDYSSQGAVSCFLIE